LTPAPVYVNPVFELAAVPTGELAIKLDGRRLASDRYAWDGWVLWQNTTIVAPSELKLAFE
jgi:hypothetical protein